MGLRDEERIAQMDPDTVKATLVEPINIKEYDRSWVYFKSLKEHPHIAPYAVHEQIVPSKAVNLATALTENPPKSELHRVIWGTQAELDELFLAMGAKTLVVITDMVPTLAGLVDDTDHVREPRLRTLAAALLGMLGPGAQAAVLPLAEGAATNRSGPDTWANQELKDFKAACLLALQTFGEAAAPATEKVVIALDDEDSKVRQFAAQVLGGVDDTAARFTKQLALSSKDSDVWVQEAALKVLRGLGSLAVDTVPVLGDVALESKHWHVQALAAEALGNMGADAVDAVPKLAAALGKLSDDQWHQKAPMCTALGRIGPEAAAAAPELVATMRATTVDVVREEAWKALMAMGSDAKQVLPELVSIMEDESMVDDHAINKRGMAVRILGI